MYSLCLDSPLSCGFPLLCAKLRSRTHAIAGQIRLPKANRRAPFRAPNAWIGWSRVDEILTSYLLALASLAAINRPVSSHGTGSAMNFPPDTGLTSGHCDNRGFEAFPSSTDRVCGNTRSRRDEAKERSQMAPQRFTRLSGRGHPSGCRAQGVDLLCASRCTKKKRQPT